MNSLPIKPMIKAKSQAGFTLIELISSMAIFSLLIVLIGQAVWQQSQATTRIRLESEAQETVQLLHKKLERALSSSKRVLGRGTIADGLLTKLEDVPANAVVLPTIRPFGVLTPTKTCNIDDENFFWPLAVGNAFFHVEAAKTINDYGPGIFPRKLDLFQFVLYYPKPSTQKISALSLPVLELTEWRSAYFVEYQDYMGFLSSLSTTERSSVLARLQSLNVEALWNSRSDTVLNAFHNLTNNPNATESSTRKPAEYVVPKLVERHALMFQNTQDTQLTLAYNTNTDKSDPQYFPTKTTVPVFYNPNPTPNAASCGPQATPNTAPTSSAAFEFPGGFEVGIVGGSSGREVLFSTTFVSKAARVGVENHDQIVLVAREF